MNYKLKVYLLFLVVGTVSVFSLKANKLDRNYTGYYMWEKGKTGILSISFSRFAKDPAYKQKFWEKIKQNSDQGNKNYYIYSLHFPRVSQNGKKYKLPPWAVAQKLLDNFFESTHEVPTYPEMLFAVCPAEENITWGGQIEIQNKIYDYLTKKYKLKVYQWLSEPFCPRLDIKADGWIFDAYSVNNEFFFRHLQKFILYGKPVVPVLWAAEPGLSGYYKKDGVQGILKAVKPKFEYCRELNLPVILFACSNKLGSVNIWMNSQNAPFPELRKFFFTQLKWLSSDEAVTTPKHTVPVYNCSGDENDLFSHKINFNRFKFVDNCLIDGVYNLRLDKSGVSFSSDAKNKTVLTWHFKPTSSFINSNAVLSYDKKDKNAQIKFEYSLDQKKWHPSQAEDNKLTLSIPKSKCVYLRIVLDSGNILLRNIMFKAKLVPVKSKVTTLKEQNNQWVFEEDFNTKKFVHYMTYKPTKQLLFKKGYIGLQGRKGYTVAWDAKQKIEVPQAIKKVKLKVNCYADKRNWGGVVKIGISLNGKNVIKELSPSPKTPRQTRFNLELNAILPKAATSFYIHLMMRNGSGVYKKNKTAANIYNYEIIASK